MVISTICLLVALAVGVHANAPSSTQCVSLKDTMAQNKITLFLEGIDTLEANNITGSAALGRVVRSTKQLAESDQLTVFVPTDAAFQKNQEEFEALQRQGGRLLQIFFNHFAAGRLGSANFTDDATEVETVNRKTLSVTKPRADRLAVELEGGGLSAQVVTPDVISCTAVMHIIDNVLLVPSNSSTPSSPPPPAPVPAATPPPQAVPPEAPPPSESGADPPLASTPPPRACMSFREAAERNDLTIFLEGLRNLEERRARGIRDLRNAIDFNRTISTDKTITIFAPNDDAFTEKGTRVANLSTSDLMQVYFNLVVPGTLKDDNVTDGETEVTAVNQRQLILDNPTGGPWTVELDEDVNGDVAEVVKSNIDTCAGVMHIIDAIFVSPSNSSNSTNTTTLSLDGSAPAEAPVAGAPAPAAPGPVPVATEPSLLPSPVPAAEPPATPGPSPGSAEPSADAPVASSPSPDLPAPESEPSSAPGAPGGTSPAPAISPVAPSPGEVPVATTPDPEASPTATPPNQSPNATTPGQAPAATAPGQAPVATSPGLAPTPAAPPDPEPIPLAPNSGNEGNEGNEGEFEPPNTNPPDCSGLGCEDDGNEGDEGNEGNEGVGDDDGDEGNEGNEGDEGDEGGEGAGDDDGDEGNEGNEGTEGDEGEEGNEGDEGDEGLVPEPAGGGTSSGIVQVEQAETPV